MISSFFVFFVFFSCALCPEAAAVDALIHEDDEVGFSLVPESVKTQPQMRSVSYNSFHFELLHSCTFRVKRSVVRRSFVGTVFSGG